jgi:hypothetical protein
VVINRLKPFQWDGCKVCLVATGYTVFDQPPLALGAFNLLENPLVKGLRAVISRDETDKTLKATQPLSQMEPIFTQLEGSIRGVEPRITT